MKQTVINEPKELSKLLENKTIFVVRTPSLKKLELNKLFLNDGVLVFDKFSPNPTFEQVSNAVKLFNTKECDYIVAAGGGSAIDIAKSVKLFSNLPEESYLNKNKWDPVDVPIIAIPSTAGSGSEATRHAVIYKDGIKQSISHERIVPEFVVMWEDALATLPNYQKKSTMFDALCQAIESWWSVNATKESIEYSKKTIRLIKKNWKNYLNNDKSTYRLMMEAAYFAGCAINITATTAAHAMSYGLTSRYKIPHGHAVALCMYIIWKHMIEERMGELIETQNIDLLSVLSDINGEISFAEYELMLKETNMDSFEADIMEEDVMRLVETVNPERLKNHPEVLDINKLKDLYREVLGL